MEQQTSQPMHSAAPTEPTESQPARRAGTVQEALHRFAQMISSKWVFEEASVALDAGDDYKLTIHCTESSKGYIVALHRHQSQRLGHNSFIKLSHDEWEQQP